MRARLPFALPVCLLAVLAAGCTTPGNTFTVHEENDLFSPVGSTDRYYTQGLRASWVFPKARAPELAKSLAEQAPVFNDFTEAVGVVVGQNIYTPEDISKRRLLRRDRPYAGWLYAGLLVANVERGGDDPTADRLDSYELDVGIVGSASQGERAQKTVHRIIDSPTPHGWDNQLHHEPGLLFRYEQRRRLLVGDAPGGLQWDVIGGFGGSLGNIAVHGGAGFDVRLGSRVPRDFGVSTIDRTVVDIGPREPSERVAWYLFGGAEGRLVAHNLFLDGNTFRDSHSVEAEDWLAEFRGGLALEWRNWRLTYTLIARTRDFELQRGSQQYGSLSLQYAYDF